MGLKEQMKVEIDRFPVTRSTQVEVPCLSEVTPRCSDSRHRNLPLYSTKERTQEELLGLYCTEDNTRRVFLRKPPRERREDRKNLKTESMPETSSWLRTRKPRRLLRPVERLRRPSLLLPELSPSFPSNKPRVLSKRCPLPPVNRNKLQCNWMV